MYKKFAINGQVFRWIIIGSIITLVIVGIVEYLMGRSFFGPDGKFGLWEGNLLSIYMSQRFCDPYSLTNILHGFIFYFLLWVIDRKMWIVSRFLIALCLEAGWEIIQNSSHIIELYNSRSISITLLGDSIINSLADLLMMIFGFWIAYLIKPTYTITLFVFIEIVLLFWIHDNLTLNTIMLFSPIDAIKNWQLDHNASIRHLLY